MVKVRGSLIQLLRLHRVFDTEPEFTKPSEGIVVICDLVGRAYGLMVDRLVGQQQVVIKKLKYAYGDLKGVSGSAILGDGHVGLILDVKGLIELAQQSNGNIEAISNQRSAFSFHRSETVELPPVEAESPLPGTDSKAIRAES
jgi:chemotaxis protein histidine kinase CheA